MTGWITAFNEIASAWAAAMERASWHGGIALALVWVACRVLPGLSPRVRCWLWRLAYLKLLLALLWATPVDLPLLPARSATALPFPPIPFSTGFAPAAAVPLAAPPSGLSSAGGLFLLWLLGMGGLAGRMIGRWRSTQGLRRSIRPLAVPELVTCCVALCRQLGLRRPPRLMEGEGVAGPMLVGLRHPVILLPSSLLAACTLSELRLVLAHELAHVKRRDLLWGWLAILAHGCFFFHPLLWLVRAEARLAQEVACDEMALQATRAGAGEYGALLLKVAVQRRPDLQPGFIAAHAVETYRTLKRRLLAMQRVRSEVPRAGGGAGGAVALLALLALVPWRVVAGGEVTFLDLQPFANQKLSANFQGDQGTGNDLTSLPRGDQLFAGVRFRVGEGCIQLGNSLLPGKPAKVEAIPVNRAFATLHILHAAGWGNGAESSPYFVADDTAIGQYTLHYEDGSTQVIPIVYGQDVRDWWAAVGSKGVTRGQVAWTGQNEVARSFGAAMIRLYLVTWTNPRPQDRVVRIDYASTQTAAAPFCVAITCAG